MHPGRLLFVCAIEHQVDRVSRFDDPRQEGEQAAVRAPGKIRHPAADLAWLAVRQRSHAHQPRPRRLTPLLEVSDGLGIWREGHPLSDVFPDLSRRTIRRRPDVEIATGLLDVPTLRVS